MCSFDLNRCYSDADTAEWRGSSGEEEGLGRPDPFAFVAVKNLGRCRKGERLCRKRWRGKEQGMYSRFLPGRRTVSAATSLLIVRDRCVAAC